MYSDRILAEATDGTATNGTTSKLEKARKPPLGRNLLVRSLFILGMVSLSYLLGAVVMFFELPSSGFLNKAFIGAQAWHEQKQATSPAPGHELLPVTITRIDKPDKTFDGFTLYMVLPVSKAFLINMQGDVVHEWTASFSQIWPKATHVRGPVTAGRGAYFFGGHLYPNGDLLVVFHGFGSPVWGYGLAKLDKNSNVLWRYSANVHHDVDVGEDGTIYALRQEIAHTPPSGLEYIPTPYIADYLVLLSPEGVELKRIDILAALRDSPYSPLLSPLERPDKQAMPPASREDDARRRDVLHTNFVNVLSRKLAPKFPLFKAGQVLISMRHLDAIAVLDPESSAVVWAAAGPWEAQHDPQFLDNGRLLIFDNLGSPKGSRVLEYDPQTQALPWSYSGENRAPFLNTERGMSQRLPNGNTLIVNSQGGEMLEVTPSKEVVWCCSCDGYLITTGRRYSMDQLHFLKGAQHARP